MMILYKLVAYDDADEGIFSQERSDSISGSISSSTAGSSIGDSGDSGVADIGSSKLTSEQYESKMKVILDGIEDPKERETFLREMLKYDTEGYKQRILYQLIARPRSRSLEGNRPVKRMSSSRSQGGSPIDHFPSGPPEAMGIVTPEVPFELVHIPPPSRPREDFPSGPPEAMGIVTPEVPFGLVPIPLPSRPREDFQVVGSPGDVYRDHMYMGHPLTTEERICWASGRMHVIGDDRELEEAFLETLAAGDGRGDSPLDHYDGFDGMDEMEL